MLLTAESSACIPDAQLRITVQPGTFIPQPIRKRDDAADVHFVDRRRRAAQDHLVELRRRERLAHEKRAAGGRREVGRRERARAGCAT